MRARHVFASLRSHGESTTSTLTCGYTAATV
jgi:hypothetical protein